METVAMLVSISVGYMLARLVSLWVLWRRDQTWSKIIKNHDSAFLRSCHIQPIEEDHEQSHKN